MNKKKEWQQDDVPAGDALPQKEAGGSATETPEGKTEIKNAHASGLGSMGRSDETLLQKDEGEMGY